MASMTWTSVSALRIFHDWDTSSVFSSNRIKWRGKKRRPPSPSPPPHTHINTTTTKQTSKQSMARTTSFFMLSPLQAHPPPFPPREPRRGYYAILSPMCLAVEIYSNKGKNAEKNLVLHSPHKSGPVHRNYVRWQDLIFYSKLFLLKEHNFTQTVFLSGLGLITVLAFRGDEKTGDHAARATGVVVRTCT